MRLKSGLTSKFAAMSGAVFCMWLAFGVYMNYSWYEQLVEADPGKGAALSAGAVAAAVARDMAGSNYEGVRGVLGAMSEDKDIRYVRVSDASGKVVEEVKDRGGQAELVLAQHDVTYGGAKVGNVTLGVSATAGMAPMVHFVGWQILAVTMLGLASALTLVYSLKMLVLTPVRRMNSMLGEMAQGGGDLTQMLDVRTSDEIGELAGNFNNFVERLRGMVARAQDSSFRVVGLTDRLGEKSKGIMSGARDQAEATNENFKALERVAGSVQDVAGSAESLSITAQDSSATVTEMAAQVDLVAEAAGELSGYVEEASTSIAEMTGSTKEVADNVGALADLASRAAEGIARIEVSITQVEEKAKESARLSRQVAEDAGTLGNEAMSRYVAGMERIHETVDDASEVIERLGKRSGEIGRILGVIDEVTKQTSLLALNAAILAAQSGEHGKGFSVVADEIKDLAERTNASTGEIARLIKAVQEESQAAVGSMREGRERVLEGVQMAHGAAAMLSGMLESSNLSSGTAAGIEKDTVLQVAAVGEVAEAVKNVHQRLKSIERATVEQSKGSVLIAQAAEKMNDIAKELKRAMSEQARGIREFAQSLEESREVVGIIAQATKSQSTDSSGLVNSMEKYLDIAQKNSAISGEMEAAVTELLRQAETLREEMGRFKV